MSITPATFKLTVIIVILFMVIIGCGYQINSQERLIDRMSTSMLEEVECYAPRATTTT